MFKDDSKDYVPPKDDAFPEKADIQQQLADYLDSPIDGHLVFRIPNARSLTSFSGSKMSKLLPKIKLQCNADPLSSKPVEGVDPDWNFTGRLEVKAKKKDNLEVKLVVESEGNFLGQIVLPFANFLKTPESWLLNGYYDLVERKEKLAKGEKTASLGLVYIQMKWSPAEYPDTKSYPPYLTDFSKNKGQIVSS